MTTIANAGAPPSLIERMRTVRTFTTSSGCILMLAATLVLGACGGSGAADHTQDDRALRTLVEHTVAAAMKRDFTEYGKYYAPQRTLALPGVAIAEESGTPKIELPAGYAIKMVTVKTGFSAAGDLGYALGTYEQTAPDKSGQLKNTVGKWMSVFKKQTDGTWGAVADTFNVDPST